MMDFYYEQCEKIAESIYYSDATKAFQLKRVLVGLVKLAHSGGMEAGRNLEIAKQQFVKDCTNANA